MHEHNSTIEEFLLPDNSGLLRDQLALVSPSKKFQVWWQTSGLNYVPCFFKDINKPTNTILLHHGTTGTTFKLM